jgi:predicted O-linked N-acetylglucosamine transferase (SPINDLY family)
MTTDILSPALLGAMAQKLSVPDLVRAAETLKGSGQTASAEALYGSWIEHNAQHPLLAAVLFNHSVLLTDLGALERARQCLERAIALNPDFMAAYINLGRVYERQGNVALAIVQWSAALARMAAVNGTAVTYKTTALNQSARALEALNQDDAAENLLRQSLEIDPAQREAVQHLVALRQRQCKWPAVLPSERVSHELLMRGLSPLSAAALTDDPLFQLALAAHYNTLDVGMPAGVRSCWPVAEGSASRRLKIGYLSSDFREHAVGFLMTDVLGLHDRQNVEVFAYYCGPEARDPLHAHFQATTDHWIPISHLDDAAAAERMVADGIQILVDLNGYTREARLKLVARRPAPVIINWLGYPGTMGSPYHHFLIADDWIIPPSEELYYSEKVLRLPCYQPSARKRQLAPEQPTRRGAGLPEDAVVFCCFNGIHKLTRFTLDRWLQILARVPGSVLWLLSSDEATHERLRAYAAHAGIEPERLVFAAKLANPAHLARYVLADLFLDTTPYGAHTTASDALRMGVPVLTVSGRSFASRVCGSLARAAGLPELVCGSTAEYVDKAVELGTDPGKLQALRAELVSRTEQCTLFDTPLLVRHLEELYREAWEAFRAGRLPVPALGNLDVFLEAASRVNHEDQELQAMTAYERWWLELLGPRLAFRPLGADARLAELGVRSDRSG